MNYDYYGELKTKLDALYDIANKARSQGYDPEDYPDIPLANDMAERVVNLVKAIHKDLDVEKTAQLIRELEKEYGFLDWRVALKLIDYALEGKIIPYDDKLKKIDLGVRLGLAYITMGTVSAPLEGLVELKLKKRRDGKDYLAVYYAGPIRGAGGTAAAVSVLLADYARKKAGIAEYDPTPEEIERYKLEIHTYHDRVARLQYHPTDEEIEFLIKHIPVEVNGDPTSDKEVPAYKNLDRVETNRIRGGMCLVLGEGVAQKAKKIWKKLKKWGKDFGLEHWFWLEEFLDLQKKIQEELAKQAKEESGSEEEENKNVKRKMTIFGKDKIETAEVEFKFPPPSGKYLSEITAGRPIFALPLTPGGFRLRYGRSFATGFATSGVHPATMILTYGFIAIGTQLRGERPGKSTIVTPVTSIHPPIARLKDGSVIKVKTVDQAKKILNNLDKILFLGDILIAFGDWLANGASLAPSPYVPEWWVQEFERAAMQKVDGFNIEFDVMKPRALFKIEGLDKLAKFLDIDEKRLKRLLRFPLDYYPTFEEARKISERLGVPLHPEYTFFWRHIHKEDVITLIEELKKAKVEEGKIIFDASNVKLKRILEKIFVEHKRVGDNFVIEEEYAQALIYQLGNLDLEKAKKELANSLDALDLVNKLSPVGIRDVAGTYIGYRMGRPEKAKMREMRGSPQVLFPVGEEGGKMRNVMEAYQKGKVVKEFAIYYCPKCKRYTVYRKCHRCGSRTVEMYVCEEKIRRLRYDLYKKYKNWKKVDEELANGKWVEAVTRSKSSCERPKRYTTIALNIREYVDAALKKLKLHDIPKVVKGVKGTSNRDRIVERLEKGFLRAVAGVYVNKDGTIRYDGTQIPLTHFRPRDLYGVTIEQLKRMGYTHDIYGLPLKYDYQILQLKPQDVILPYGIYAKSRTNKNKIIRVDAVESLKKIAKFVDLELEKLYDLKPYYNANEAKDLIGHIVFGLAPHTSAAVVGRLIGFTKAQGIIGHPIWHAGQRRNCFHPDTYVFFFDEDGNLIFDKIQKVVESILETKEYVKLEEDAGVLIIYPKRKYFVISVDDDLSKLEIKGIRYFTKRKDNKWVKVKTTLGKEFIVTEDHPIVYYENGEYKVIEASKLQPGVYLPTVLELDNVQEKDLDRIDLYELLKEELPLGSDDKKVWLSKPGKRKKIKRFLEVNEELLWFLGLFVAEGYFHENETTFQVVISSTDERIREKLKQIFGSIGINISVKGHKITISSRIFLELMKKLGFNHGAKEKSIPSWVLQLPKKKLASFLAGFIDGDGTISQKAKEIELYTASEKLLNQLLFILSRFGVFAKVKVHKNRFGTAVLDRYKELGKQPPESTVYELKITGREARILSSVVKEYLVTYKREEAKQLANTRYKEHYYSIIYKNDHLLLDKVESVEIIKEDTYSYSISIDGNEISRIFLVQQNLLLHNCDGDETAVMLGLDALINFSREYLPDARGSRTMDAPLVLTLRLSLPSVDDEVHNMDIVYNYPLEFYYETLKGADPGEVKSKTGIVILGDYMDKPIEEIKIGFTHPTESIMLGNIVSLYKKLKTMQEKVEWQLKVAEKIEAVDESIVAEVVIERHFMPDIKGNLRGFSSQGFRCTKCDEVYDRMPMGGKCPKCGGNITLTIHEGTVKKYLPSALYLARKYNIKKFTKQSLLLLDRRIKQVFGEGGEGKLHMFLKKKSEN